MRFNTAFFELLRHCPFKCKYCYEKDYRGGAKRILTLDECKRVVDYLVADNQMIQLSFGGGEPLILFDKVIKPLVLYAHSFESKEVNININTNGLLMTAEVLQFCKENEVRVSISLDGPRHMHNANRIWFKDSKGTYDAIISNTQELIKYNIPFTVCQSTYNSSTVQFLYESYLFAKSLGFKSWYAAPDIYNCHWTKENFQTLQEQFERISEDYYSTKRVMEVPFIDNSTSGNPRFKFNNRVLLVLADGRTKVSRINATSISQELDEPWYIGHIDDKIVDEERLTAFIKQFGDDADVNFYAKRTKLCANCPITYCYNGGNPNLIEINNSQPEIQCYQKRLIAQQVQEMRERYGVSN